MDSSVFWDTSNKNLYVRSMRKIVPESDSLIEFDLLVLEYLNQLYTFVPDPLWWGKCCRLKSPLSHKLKWRKGLNERLTNHINNVLPCFQNFVFTTSFSAQSRIDGMQNKFIHKPKTQVWFQYGYPVMAYINLFIASVTSPLWWSGT